MPTVFYFLFFQAWDEWGAGGGGGCVSGGSGCHQIVLECRTIGTKRAREGRGREAEGDKRQEG